MSDGLPIDGQMIDCEKSILSEQAALRLGPAWGGGAPPLASAPHFLSRMLKKSASGVLASLRGSTYRSVRLASSLAAALPDVSF